MSVARSASKLRAPSAYYTWAPVARTCVCPCQRRNYATHKDAPSRTAANTKSKSKEETKNAPRKKETHSKPGIHENALMRDNLPARAIGKEAEEDAEEDMEDEDSSQSSRKDTTYRPSEAIPMDRDPEIMAQRLDPHPSRTIAWERKMIVKSVKRRGRLSRQEVIKRTEREALYKSDYWKTSMKKLAPLARQIAGKTLDAAIVQMDFSRKKNAVFIADFLGKAKITAHVERGMGLGQDSPARRKRIDEERMAANLPPLDHQQPEQKAQQQQHDASKTDAAASQPEVLAPGTEMPQHPSDESVLGNDAKRDGSSNTGGPDQPKMKLRPGTKVLLKGKTPHNIYDSTTLYIAQAWVNKGSYGVDSMKRARGRVDRLNLPQTSISVLIKEEATRLREDQQRKEREAKKKVWVQLPDRPVSAQRPYYCW